MPIAMNCGAKIRTISIIARWMTLFLFRIDVALIFQWLDKTHRNVFQILMGSIALIQHFATANGFLCTVCDRIIRCTGFERSHLQYTFPSRLSICALKSPSICAVNVGTSIGSFPYLSMKTERYLSASSHDKRCLFSQCGERSYRYNEPSTICKVVAKG